MRFLNWEVIDLRCGCLALLLPYIQVKHSPTSLILNAELTFAVTPTFFYLQLTEDDPNSPVVFFNWYYWSINIGTLFALAGVAYLQQQGSSFGFDGFFDGYLIGVGCLALALLVFLTGKTV